VGSFDPTTAERDSTLAVALAALCGAPGNSTNGVPLVLFARARANGQGLTDLGFARESARLASELREGSLRAVLIVGEDPVAGSADPGRTADALAGLEFLAVADSVPTATTAAAHVVLPMAAPGESNGSFTNSELRVQAVAGPLAPPAGLTELELVSALSSALGAEPIPTDAEAARGAMDVPGYPSGRLGPEGVRWAEGMYEGGLVTDNGSADLSLPAGSARERPFDPRWSDAIEVLFSRAVEEFGLPPHVVKRSGVRA
jgi:formate dehydrogenase major subunit